MRRHVVRLSLLVATILVAAAGARPARGGTSREVFGYWPYWQQAGGTSGFRWDLLSVVGFFSAEARGDGSIATWHGWDGAAGAGLVADAHGHGKKAVLVVTCFDQATIHAVLTSGRAAAIANLVAGVEAAGGDGVNLDFEGLDDLDRDAMVTFTTDLAAALRAAVPGAHLSLATPAVDWSMAWDYAGLADAADQLMIMAYDYHWRGSDPGPVAPLTSGSVWSYRNVTWTVDQYLAAVGAARRGQLLLGLPLYGYDYPSTGPEVPGTTRGAATAVFYDDAELAAPGYGRLWDVPSQTPYYEFQGADGWHQVWYDDDESIGLKLDLAEARDLGGIGIWALGYEGGSGSFWSAVETHLAAPPDAGPGGADAAPPAGPADGGVPPGTPDAGDGSPGDGDGGCRVAAAGRTGPVGLAPAFLLLAALAVVTGARRRRSSRGSSGSADPGP